LLIVYKRGFIMKENIKNKDINKKIYDITGGYIKKNIPCGFFELKINKNNI